MARTQTLVQLTDDLVETLDRRAAVLNVSRSALIRDLLTEALGSQRSDELSRRMIEGYRDMPQDTGEDAWGDLDEWTQANARRNMAALRAEEQS
ncbi:MAG: ribbon-helix-helix domain-containing protein [Solirubrobacteraceae bacterium]